MKNNTPKIIGIAWLLTLMAVFSVDVHSDNAVSLLPVADGDLNATILKDVQTIQSINSSRDEIATSWVIPEKTALITSPKAYLAQSKAYWVNVTGQELSQGVQIKTTAPGAIVKISPNILHAAGDRPGPELRFENLMIIDSRGVEHSGKAAIETGAAGSQLVDSDIPFSQGSLIFKIKESIGSGAITIKNVTPQNEHEKYVVSVYDKHSDVVLTLQMASDTVLAGQRAAAAVEYRDNSSSLQISNIDSYLISPSGKRINADIRRDNGKIVSTSYMPDEIKDGVAGLWELHVVANGKYKDVDVQRNVKTSFAYSIPDAQLTKTVKVVRNTGTGNSVKMEFGLNAVTGGRYEIRGALYGTGNDGELVPMMYADSAGWREAGSSSMDLEFELDKMKSIDVNAPYELRDLILLDQGRMMLLHRQAVALRLKQ
jgi:hypothetical protein